jgi:hypothetical protein
MDAEGIDDDGRERQRGRRRAASRGLRSMSSGRTAAACGSSRGSRRGRAFSPTPSRPTGVDHPLQVGPRRGARHLRHAGERKGHPAGHPDRALGQRSRLGGGRLAGSRVLPRTGDTREELVQGGLVRPSPRAEFVIRHRALTRAWTRLDGLMFESCSHVLVSVLVRRRRWRSWALVSSLRAAGLGSAFQGPRGRRGGTRTRGR